MTGWPFPTPLYNPLITPIGQEPSAWELLAGPAGLIAFLPLIPLVRLLGTVERRWAIIATALTWVVATSGFATGFALMALALLGLGAVEAVAGAAHLRATSQTVARLLIWGTMTALVAPLWWFAQVSWYGWEAARPAVLHNAGFAYMYLRLIAWGIERTGGAQARSGLIDSLAWLLYAPTLRLGPVVSRHDFLERLADWDPRRAVDWREAGRRGAYFLVGAVALGTCVALVPRVASAGADFYSTPAAYSTGALLRVLYCVPLQVYLMLWVYNELAATLAVLVGVRVDDNFNYLPAATSVRDFWRRWHVTVGAWLREHVYIALGGKHHPNIAIAGVFLFCAVWHGAAWSFMLWGVSQAVAMMLQRGWDHFWRESRSAYRPRGRCWSAACWLVTMNYQAVTIMIFTDFEHCGLRLIGELARRVTAGAW